MVKVPSPDRFHVVSALILFMQKIPRIISDKNFFMIVKKIMAQTFRLVSSQLLVSPNTFDADK